MELNDIRSQRSYDLYYKSLQCSWFLSLQPKINRGLRPSQAEVRSLVPPAPQEIER